MKHRCKRLIGLGLLPVLTILNLAAGHNAAGANAQGEPPHEVWMLDQSNTYDANLDGTLDSGGTLYIYSGAELAGQRRQVTPEVIDLGGALAESIRTATGTAPVRPHFITFNKSNTHAIVSFVATGHVLIFEAATRTPVFVVDVGAQAHAAVPSDDESYILVANQNGKLLQRINTDYSTSSFALDAGATLNLAAGTTPSGALKQDPVLRPDNAPILALPDRHSELAYVTLRGGGLFVVNARSSPMEIVAEYTTNTVQPAGLLATQLGDKLFFNSGGGGGAALGFQAVLYSLPTDSFSTTPSLTPDNPAPVTVFDRGGTVDSHGLLLTRHGRYLWAADRAANTFVVVDTASDAVVNEIDLVGSLSDDPAPDIAGLSPSGNRVYVSLRGPNPLTGNNPVVNNAKGSTPGLGVISVGANGFAGDLKSLHRVSNLDAANIERADPHGLAVRGR